MRLAADDKAGVVTLLGLDPVAMGSVEDFDKRFAEVRAAAAEGLQLEAERPDRVMLVLGNELWPFPFPVTKADDGWSFDTFAGVEEVIARRIGENELQAIETVRSYVGAQLYYFSDDWDGDGVMEYAQKLRSTPGSFDGLYWAAENGSPPSPVGPYVDDVEIGSTKPGADYFGYRFRVLTSQGDNVVGDAFDYVINGNMICGFGLVAWPSAYGETGVKTFLVSRSGTIYEKDLGPQTEAEASGMKRFDPDGSWDPVP
jgi:hypothetical protein